jgi:hypothetical protein
MIVLLLQGLSSLCGLVNLVCFIMVLVQMFKRGETTMGIVCIVTLFCCGIGGLITFVYGWTKAAAWDITKIMIVWSGVILAQLVLFGLVFVMAVPELDNGFDPSSLNIDFPDPEFNDLSDDVFEAFDEQGTPVELP